MVRRWTMLAGLCAGCYQPATERSCAVACPTGLCPNGLDCFGGICKQSVDEVCPPPGDGDGGLDGRGIGDAGICFGQGLVMNVCLATLPTREAPYGDATIDTTSGCDMQLTDGSNACVLVARTFTFNGTVRVTGSRPVVFLGVERVTVTTIGTLDAASRVDGSTGAGATGSTDCAVGLAGQNDPMQIAGGGGAGGSFGALGGNGGGGFNGQNAIGGGVAHTPLPPSSVRAGCSGGRGGNATQVGGSGGTGGGAVYLLSGGRIEVYGAINASGAGGKGPDAGGGGGGGGGSGGLIGLDAPLYDLVPDARVFAVGGSGATGSTGGAQGVDGLQATGPQSPGTTMSFTSAGNGGAGGASGAGNSGGSSTTTGAGGGGGGGTGFIGIANKPVSVPGMFAPQPVDM